MITNNLTNIQGLCNELLTCFHKNKTNIPIPVQQKVENKLNHILQLTEELMSDGDPVNIKAITTKLETLWQDNISENVILARRGMNWLGNGTGTINEVGFLTKMADLGRLISEDKNLKNSPNKTIYSKEEALKMRNLLSQDKEFLNSLYNKTHIKHTASMAKLNQLNRVIAGS